MAKISQTPSGAPGRLLLALAAPLAFIFASLSFGGCNGTTPIKVSQADSLSINVEDTQGNPLTGADIGFYKINFKINTPATTPPTPYSTPGDFEESATMETTDGNGQATFFLPRHGVVNTGDVLVVKQPWGNMYSFVLTRNITIDMVTTVFYEMIAYSTASPAAFSVDELLTLQNQAYQSINTALGNYWINPKAPMAKLHRAYQNALASDTTFMNSLIQVAMLHNYSLYGYIAYQNFNNRTQRVGISPTQAFPVVVETNNLTLQFSGMDKDQDVVFYNWVVTSQAPNGNGLDLYKGQMRFSEVLGNSTSLYHFSTGYDTDPWFQSDQPVYVSAVVGDGGQPVIQTWTVHVVNKERIPVFTTAPVTSANEDTLWTYIPSAYSPDGAPLTLALSMPYPAGMDMCVPSNAYMPSPPANYPALATVPTWNWQIAGTPCTTPYLVTWTPNNCQSGPVLSPQAVSVSAVDATGAGSTQSFLVTVLENSNTSPTVTSTPGSLTITGPTPWSYSPTVSDPELALSTAHSRGCVDVMVYSLTTSPTGATIDPATGAVAWTPTGDQVGANSFTMQVKDTHGGVTTQNWTVTVIDMNDVPTISVGGCGTVAHEAGVLSGVVPNQYNYSCAISVSQWTVNSLFQLTITGAPGTITPLPAAGLWRPKAGISGFLWKVTDADTIPQPGVASWPITLQVCNDGEGGKFAQNCSTYSYTLTAPKEDLPPIIAASPTVTIMGGCTVADCAVNGTSTYTYTGKFTDGNTNPADAFTFTATQPNPAGSSALTLTPVSTTAPMGTATVSWQVNNTTDLGNHVLSLKATSGLAANGGPKSVTQNWSVFVQETNYIPYFDAIPAQTGQDGTPYTYNFKSACHTSAITVPNKNLSFSLAPGAPSGMSIDPKTGVVSWNPSPDQARAAQPLSYTVNCLSKLGTPPTSTAVTVPVTLTYVNLAPQWINVPSQIIGVGQAYSLPLMADDIDGDSVTISATGVPASASFTASGNSGTLTWTPTALNVGTYTITFRATDGTLTTNMPVSFQVVDTPVVLSHAVIHATAGNPYHYEIHALDPVGGGLTFSVDPTSPGGVQVTPLAGSTTAAKVSWNPSLSFVGDQVVQINITDTNHNILHYSWHITVVAGAENPPVINQVTPTTTPVVATEGITQTFTVSAIDSDGDPLHYAYYWDGTWVGDTSSTFSYTPLGSESGDHVLTVAVTDGASADVTQTVNIHVRDALPQVASTYTVSGGSLSGLVTNARSGQLYAAKGGGSPAVLLFDESTYSAGPTATVGLPFAPQRMSLKNNLVSPTDYVLYFAQSGDLMAGSNTYATLDSTGAENPCPAGACFGPAFLSGFSFSGGTQSVYVPSNTTAYYIKSSNPRYIGRYVSGVANTDIDLGAGASANAMVYDPATAQIFVATGGTNKINVIDPASNAVSATISGAGNNPALLALNSPSGKLYAYSPADGSIAEILTSGAALNTVKSGFPTSASIGANARNLLVENTDDDTIYLAIPDTHQLVIYDVNNSGIHSLTLPAGPDDLSIDLGTHNLFGGEFSANVIFKAR